MLTAKRKLLPPMLLCAAVPVFSFSSNLSKNLVECCFLELSYFDGFGMLIVSGVVVKFLLLIFSVTFAVMRVQFSCSLLAVS